MTVSVFNPAPGGGTSPNATFTVTGKNPVPAIGKIVPSTVIAGSPAFSLKIKGKDLTAVMDYIDFSGIPYPALPEFARVALKTKNLDYNGRLCMVSAGTAYNNFKVYAVDLAGHRREALASAGGLTIQDVAEDGFSHEPLPGP